MLTPARRRARLLRGVVLAFVLSMAGLLLATPAQAADEQPPVPPVLLIGMTGVRWDDVTTLTTPALWSLSREGSVGLVAARSVASRSCPADGWLAVSSGTRVFGGIWSARCGIEFVQMRLARLASRRLFIALPQRTACETPTRRLTRSM